MIELGELDFEEYISDDVAIVDFHAAWCAPCKSIEKVLNELEVEISSVRFAKLNIEDCPAIAAKYNVMKIPSLLMFKNGAFSGIKVGPHPKKDIKRWIEGR